MSRGAWKELARQFLPQLQEGTGEEMTMATFLPCLWDPVVKTWLLTKSSVFLEEQSPRHNCSWHIWAGRKQPQEEGERSLAWQDRNRTESKSQCPKLLSYPSRSGPAVRRAVGLPIYRGG
jgi:hypothetical protein